ncbi:hypothetical protein Mapa_008207 [Marchantia paleacea]|nr:hypothetical protein Mapa_008207 [Marchantia paleacea]
MAFPVIVVLRPLGQLLVVCSHSVLEFSLNLTAVQVQMFELRTLVRSSFPGTAWKIEMNQIDDGCKDTGIAYGLTHSLFHSANFLSLLELLLCYQSCYICSI